MTKMQELQGRCQTRLPICVGLDTAADYLPEGFRRQFHSVDQALLEFNRAIIDSTNELVAGYKVQIAYYEARGLAGMATYAATLAYLRQVGAVIIADVKRGDIAATAQQYAVAHYRGDFAADIITLNPYMGFDSLNEYQPYLQQGQGAFVLLQTSNPGWRDIQALTNREGQMVCQVVAEQLMALNQQLAPDQSTGPVGAVIGCTDIQAAERWRDKLQGMMALIPGYGAQGGSAAIVKALLGAKTQGVVNLSRALLLAWRKRPASDFAVAAREELLALASQLGYD